MHFSLECDANQLLGTFRLFANFSGLSNDTSIFPTLSSRPEQIIATAMVRAVEGPAAPERGTHRHRLRYGERLTLDHATRAESALLLWKAPSKLVPDYRPWSTCGRSCDPRTVFRPGDRSRAAGFAHTNRRRELFWAPRIRSGIRRSRFAPGKRSPNIRGRSGSPQSTQHQRCRRRKRSLD